jgi:hypothetical protein
VRNDWTNLRDDERTHCALQANTEMMNWGLIVEWVAIITIVIAIRRLNAGDENRPPPEDDG